MPIEAIVIGAVSLILFTFKGPLQSGSSGSSSRGGGKQITDEQLIQMGRQRGLFK